MCIQLYNIRFGFRTISKIKRLFSSPCGSDLGVRFLKATALVYIK
jgi:hypothetical protein